MNSRFSVCWTVIGLAAALAAAPAFAGAPSATPDWRAVILERLQAAEYHFGIAADGSWSAPNRAHGLRVSVTDAAGLRLVPRTAVAEPWELQLVLTGVGRSVLTPPGPLTISGSGPRAERSNAGLSEWLVNEPEGIEHGFTLFVPPTQSSDDRTEPLVLEMRIEGTLEARLDDGAAGLEFHDASGRRVLRYGSLMVVDARGDRLDAAFTRAGDRLRIEVDDRGAVYPVTVDPLITVPDWLDTIDQSNARFGVSVTGAGDLNDDGYADVIVGAERFDNGQTDEGAGFVYLGGPGGPDTDPIWMAEGNHAGGMFGATVAGAGDVNHDGFDDAIFGAPRWDDGSPTDGGAAFVYYGSPNALNGGLLRPVGNPDNADWRAEGDQPGAEFGTSVARAGDINNDGVDDIVVGAVFYSNGQSAEGSAFAYHGSNPGGLALAGGTRPVGTPANANWRGESNQVDSGYGTSVASAGDVSGDSIDDILVGAPNFQNNYFDEGRVYMYLGLPGGAALSPTWTRDGGSDGASLGVAVASAGDIDNDGLDDVILGADGWSSGQILEGAAFLFHGKPGGTLGATPEWTLELNQGGAGVGADVASAGDVNNDGYSDVVVASEDFDDGTLDEGAVFLFLGAPTGLPPFPTTVYEINTAGTDYGESVASAGDVNGDGYDDIIVGADLYSLPQSQEGGAFMYFGCRDDDRDGICHATDNCPSLVNPEQEDVDGDGIGDICDACEDIDEDNVCDAPRVLIDWAGPGEQVLVQFGSPMRFLVNTCCNPGLNLNWTTDFYDDSNPPWQSGLYGVGYEDPPSGAPFGCSDLLVTTNPPSIGTISVYTRAEFTLPIGIDVETLFLGVDYDDAFVAWINGVEVYRSGEFPSGTPLWNSVLTSSHESSNGVVPTYEPLHDISLTGIPALNPVGTNVLAIGVWNAGISSSDLVLVPRLSINRSLTSEVRYLANTVDDQLGGLWRLTSFNDENWSAGNYGLGYDTAGAADQLINTEVSSASHSVYSRAHFTVSLGTVQNVFLGLDYDDGVVAWINGQEVYRTSGMPGNPGTVPAYDAHPSAHESSNDAEPDYGSLINITSAALPFLANGDNLLAIGAWRSGTSDDDLVLVPRLSINEEDLDNCQGLYNPTQSDADGDGLGDACDPDIDNDGIPNWIDNCLSVPNPTQVDWDGDYMGDECDPCEFDTANDQDGDLICAFEGYQPPMLGDQDNCPLVANTDQADLNLDGEGDACDPDIDGDGDLNGADNCPLVPNANQTNVDGDARGADCDCNDASATVWEKPAAIDDLRIARADVCVDFTCTESLAPCGGDADCVQDVCADFACTQSLGACETNADCMQDQCTDFTCSIGGNACVNNSNCTADFCANKTCTAGANPCATNADCTADACANKVCTEGLNSCTSNSQCVVSATDICVGSCALGGNPCVSNAACTQDVCVGTCTVGGNACVNSSVCDDDVCTGSCSIGLNPCFNDSVCTQPQTDLCKGECTIGGNQCVEDSVCTQPQTDVCEGSCSLSGGVCMGNGACTEPAADTLLWGAPLQTGATTVWYDTLRSSTDNNFTTATTCVESDGSNTETVEPTLPTPGDPIHFYLIRIENACPAGSNLGKDSSGTPRTGRACP